MQSHVSVSATCLPAVGKTAEQGSFAVISMGQGQEGPAERLLDKYLAEVRPAPGRAAGWVL